MVRIADDNFNDDMDSYIDRIRSKDDSVVKKVSDPVSNIFAFGKSAVSRTSDFSLKNVFKRRIPVEDDYVERVNKMDVEKDVRVKEELIKSEEELQEIDEFEEDLEDRRESVLKRFFRALRFNKDSSLDEAEFEEVLVEDEGSLEEAKVCIKILHKWVERLPPDTINEFKRGPDFVKYKDTLRKLRLIE